MKKISEAFKKLNARGIELEVRKVSTDPKLKMMDLISKIDELTSCVDYHSVFTLKSYVNRRSTMEITTLQIVLVFIVACIAGMGSILDEFQFHRPLIACTLVGIVLGDMKTGIIIGGTLEMIALGCSG